jgi:hypothetical protein
MSTFSTTRLDDIAQRQRVRRARDLAFAALVSLLATFSVVGLRSAVTDSQRAIAVDTAPAPATNLPGSDAPAPELHAHRACPLSTPIC